VLLGLLLSELDGAAPYELIDVCDRWLRRHTGARWSRLLLVDYGETVLEPVPGNGSGPVHRRHTVDDDTAGTAYREQRVVTDLASDAPDVVVHLPVTIRTERLGVLVVALPADVEGVPDEVSDAARVLAYVLNGARRYTDRYEVLRRRRDLGLAAEIQWELLPVLANELPEFSIAGALEPTYEIGGDTFDYAVNATQVVVAITDAVGHGLRAALLGSLAVTAMRNSRRCGDGILGQAATANRHLVEQFPGANFVTGILMDIELATGSGVVVNAGHPAPLLLRDGAAAQLMWEPDMPMGLDADTVYRTHRLDLRHGDRLLLLTDGITEAHVAGSPPFGTRRVMEFLIAQAHRTPAEFVRHLTAEVLAFRGGDLADDATAVCLDWR